MAHKRKRRAFLAFALVAWLAAATAGAQTTICEVQEYDDMGFSPLVGEVVTVRAAVTFPPGYLVPQYTSMYIQQDGCGVNIFCPVPPAELPFTLGLGDSLVLTGEVQEYVSTTTGAGAVTELFCSGADQITLISQGNDEPEAAILPIAECNYEGNEGRLVRTVGVVVETNFDYSMYIAEPWSGDEIQVYQSNNESVDFSGFNVGDTLDVTGVILQYDRTPPFFDGYELVPRWQSDMQYASPPELPDPVYWANATLDIPAATFNPDIGEILPIKYAAPNGSFTRIEIYDLQGRDVRLLTEAVYDGQSTLPEHYKPGYFEQGIQGWDGRDDLRRIVRAGTYICRLEVIDEDGTVSSAVAPAVVGVRLR